MRIFEFKPMLDKSIFHFFFKFFHCRLKGSFHKETISNIYCIRSCVLLNSISVDSEGMLDVR